MTTTRLDIYPISSRPTNGEQLSPKQLRIPTGDGSTLYISELADRFNNSPHGRHMITQLPRYNHNYGYDKAKMLEDLDLDVCPIGHQHDLLGHIQQVVETERDAQTLYALSDEEYAIVAFAAVIHDIGECTHEDLLDQPGISRVVGDIPSGKKKDEDRAAEAAIRQYFYDTYFPDIDGSIIEKAEAIIAHNDDSALHGTYEAAHHLQVLSTVERADHIVRKEKLFNQNSARAIALNGIANKVRDDETKKIPKSVGSCFVALEKKYRELNSYQPPYPIEQRPAA